MAIEKKLICFNKQANFDEALSAGNILEYSIVFIKDTQKIWTHGTYFSSLKELTDTMAGLQKKLVAGANITIADDTNTISAKDTTYTITLDPDTHTLKLTPSEGEEQTVDLSIYKEVPDNGKEGQVFTFDAATKKGVWKDMDTLDYMSYGVQWKPDTPDPIITRVGSRDMHRFLPLQNAMRGCIYDALRKEVVYWLDDKDWRFRADHPKRDLTPENTTEDIFTATGKWFSVDAAALKEFLDPALLLFCNNVYIRDITTQEIWRCVAVDNTTVPESPKLIFHSGTAAEIPTAGEARSFEIGSNRTGYAGEVRIRIPQLWYKSWDTDTNREVRLATSNVEGDWHLSKEFYVSPWLMSRWNKNTVDTELHASAASAYAVKALGTHEDYVLLSVDNQMLDGQNGVMVSDHTDTLFTPTGKDHINKGITYINRGTARSHYPTDDGGNVTYSLSYEQYKVLYWLYMTEYANFNSQDTYNGELTAEGFHQGGMGEGCTGWTSDLWKAYNSYYPVVPCGYHNEQGNGTGLKDITLSDADTPVTFHSFKWRGFENLFGHIWKNLDGFLGDKDTGIMYVTDDPAYFKDEESYEPYMRAVQSVTEDGWVTEFNLGDHADILARKTGGTATTYKCDYRWIKRDQPNPRYLISGGSLDLGAGAGFSALYSHNSVAVSLADIGFLGVSCRF